MKAIILAGGYGSRLSEETHLKPKPMVTIGERPILWHIMKTYSHYGINEFVICLGYKGYMIKEYFTNYYRHMADLTVDLSNNEIEIHNCNAEPWKVTLVETGTDVMTGGRIKRIAEHVKDEEAFCLTYGDGVADVDIAKLLAFHKSHGKLATLTAVQPIERFGVLDIDDEQRVNKFHEKPDDGRVDINGGYFVLSPKILDYIEGDATIWEKAPLNALSQEDNLRAFHHDGFWQCMDNVNDRRLLQDLWNAGKAPWKLW